MQDLIEGVLEQKGTIVLANGEPYAAIPHLGGYWTYRLTHDSEVYFVWHDFSSCTCPHHKRTERRCKHMAALQAHGLQTAYLHG